MRNLKITPLGFADMGLSLNKDAAALGTPDLAPMRQALPVSNAPDPMWNPPGVSERARMQAALPNSIEQAQLGAVNAAAMHQPALQIPARPGPEDNAAFGYLDMKQQELGMVDPLLRKEAEIAIRRQLTRSAI